MSASGQGVTVTLLVAFEVRNYSAFSKPQSDSTGGDGERNTQGRIDYRMQHRDRAVDGANRG